MPADKVTIQATRAGESNWSVVTLHRISSGIDDAGDGSGHSLLFSDLNYTEPTKSVGPGKPAQGPIRFTAVVEMNTN